MAQLKQMGFHLPSQLEGSFVIYGAKTVIELTRKRKGDTANIHYILMNMVYFVKCTG